MPSLADPVMEEAELGARPGWSAHAALADRMPLWLRTARMAPGPRAVAGLLVFAVLGLALAVVYVWTARPDEQPAPPLRRTLPATATALPAPPVAPAGPPATGVAGPAANTATSGVVVDVVGAVRRPGVVELPSGSRVADAVEAAGGPSARAKLASVNMARLLVDGEQVVVLRKGQHPPASGLPAAGTAGSTTASGSAGAAGSGGAAGPGGAFGPVDLDTATLGQLDALPGIGPVLAQRILDWRTQHGRFGSVDELTEVSGIGEATFADLRSLVRV
jgi:competence protein ComEA